MESVWSSVDDGEGHSRMRSRTAGTGSASLGTSGAGEGKNVAEHLSLGDFQTLLELLKVKLPENVLNDDAIRRSRKRKFSRKANIIVLKLKNGELQTALKPRLQCRTVKSAWIKNPKHNVREITEMIFFKKCENKQKALKPRWEKVLLNKHSGSKMKSPTHGCDEKHRNKKTTGSTGAGCKAARGITEHRSNEMKCLRFFIRAKGLSGVRYSREHPAEFGFLSGRMDFLLKTKGSEPGTSEYTILECKGTTQDLNNMLHRSEDDRGHVAKLNSNNRYYYQTQAYLYTLRKTQGRDAAVSAVMVFRKHQKDEDWEESDEEEEDDQDEEFLLYEDHEEELKGEFCYNYVSEDMTKFEKLNKYCKQKALPLYLAVLNKIFKKVTKTDMKMMHPCEQFILLLDQHEN